MPKAMTPVTVNASSAAPLCQALSAAGITESSLEEWLGLPSAQLQHPDCRLPLPTYHALWQRAIDILKDPALGLHMGSSAHPDRMGLVGHVFFNAATLNDALTQFCRMYSLVNEAIRVELVVDGPLAHLRYGCDNPDHYSVPDMERSLAVGVCRARHFIQPRLSIERVGFSHPAPAYQDDYAKVFECPVVFDQTVCEVVFPARHLNVALPRRNPYLHQALLKHVEPLLAKFSTRKSLTLRVRKLIWKNLSRGEVDAEMIAKALAMSRQTLYRKLKQEDKEFKALVDEVRQKKALKYLKEERYGLNEIAFLLGFSELSAFSRAFKRWQGLSPAQYRDQQRTATDAG